jgi:hypothetical protein
MAEEQRAIGKAIMEANPTRMLADPAQAEERLRPFIVVNDVMFKALEILSTDCKSQFPSNLRVEWSLNGPRLSHAVLFAGERRRYNVPHVWIWQKSSNN